MALQTDSFFASDASHEKSAKTNPWAEASGTVEFEYGSTGDIVREQAPSQ
jgi:hypothetical protein